MKVRNICILFLFFVNGCTLLPGMQNINMNNMHMQPSPNNISQHPVVIPISAQSENTYRRHPHTYLIEAPDTLNISVWKHPEFDFPLLETRMNNNSAGQIFANQFNYAINPQGRIYFPLVGNLSVADKTTDQVRLMITKRLKKYIRHPQVVVRIAEYKSKKVYVLGEVEKPGLLYITDQMMTILDAIMLSGSINPNTGDPRYIYVIRGSIAQPRIYWLNANTADALLLAENFELQSNDIIYVSTAMVTRWNRFLSQLLPTLQTVWYTKAITGK